MASPSILNTLFDLTTFKSFNYNKQVIDVKSINTFNTFNISSRGDNDRSNKTREHIIGAIINNKVPENYFVLEKWLAIKNNVIEYINSLTSQPCVKVECLHKAGRKNNYDFLIKIYYEEQKYEEFKVEFKFNAACLNETPQFVSPMKPSQYLNNSYEEFYYENYLTKLATMGNLDLPSKEDYLKQIHSDKPKCVKKYQEFYYNGCSGSSKFTGKQEHINFYNYAKELSNTSITEFINNSELNITMLSNYLQSTQLDKIYMLYTNNSLIKQTINMDDYTLISVIKQPDKYRYECTSKSGKKIKVLLRWKNGNGIAFPAFQLS
jgi:hypothetical protein